MARSLAVAQHEAAHVVVGVALGLRLREAVIGDACLRRGAKRILVGGYTWFPGAKRVKWALTLAAGIAWDQSLGDEPSRGDVAWLGRLGYRASSVDALSFAAGAILETRGAAHARVTRALLSRDLKGADIAAIARGEPITEDD